MILKSDWQKYAALILVMGLITLIFNFLNPSKKATKLPANIQQDSTSSTSDKSILLKLKIEGLHSQLGELRVAIYDSEAHFMKLEHAIFKQSCPASTSELEINLSVTSEFALSIYHDANSDGVLNKHFLGYPTEKYGFSNNPKIQFGVPQYSLCCIRSSEVSKEKTINMQVIMK